MIKEEIARHFDQPGIWRVEDAEYFCYRREESEFDSILGKQQDKGFFLELGAGRGRFAMRYARLYKRGFAVDLSENMLLSLKERIKQSGLDNLCLLRMDAENIGFKDNTFDIVMAPQVIGHCPEPEAMLKEMSRVLKPGGIGIVSTANYLSLPGLKQLMSLRECFLNNGKFLGNLIEYKKNSRVFWLARQKFVRDSYFSLKRAFKKAGLRIDEVSGSGVLPTFLSGRLKGIERRSGLFPLKYFCRTIILSFVKD